MSSGERLAFLSMGFSNACLNVSGNTPSFIDIFMRSLIGIASTSIQDLRSVVGMESSIQVLFDDAVTTLTISSDVAGEKSKSIGGVLLGKENGLSDGIGNLRHSVAILLLKNDRKDLQRLIKLLKTGRAGLSRRPRRSFIVDHSFFGQSLLSITKL